MSIERPALYIVATPIGNLGDITYRAVSTLKQADLVLAEDTRSSRRLFDRYGIATTRRSLHDHNERGVAAALAVRIKAEGLACALISDAGTPLMSDPGYVLVREAIANAVPVYPIPGACAAIAAVSASGLAANRFVFEGFLPSRRAARVKRLQALVDEPRTLVIYESPHRIDAAMADIRKVFGDRRGIAVARELTKLHETHYRGTIPEVIAAMSADPHSTRGEMVIVLAGCEAAEPEVSDARRILSVLLTRMPIQAAMEIAGALTGASRNALYQIALELKRERE